MLRDRGIVVLPDIYTNAGACDKEGGAAGWWGEEKVDKSVAPSTAPTPLVRPTPNRPNPSPHPTPQSLIRHHPIPQTSKNIGGVTVSFFEWVQNLQNFKWEEDDVNRRLDRKMTDAFAQIWRIHREKHVPVRLMAACMRVPLEILWGGDGGEGWGSEQQAVLPPPPPFEGQPC